MTASEQGKAPSGAVKISQHLARIAVYLAGHADQWAIVG